MTDIIFESFINLFQSVVVTEFLIISLGCKDKYNKKCVSAAGILITFIYLTVSNHIVFFESVGIYVYMAYSLIFSFVLLSGSVIEKIFYNVMMICCLAGSSVLGGGLVSLVVRKDFLSAIPYGTISRYIAVILVQILLVIFLGLIIKLKYFLKEKDNKYMFIMSLIPAISVIVCCFMVYRSDKSYETNVIYTFASSDEKVVSVDKNGMVTALKNGKATITITVKTTNTDFEKTLTYDITVEEIPLESIEIKGDVTSLEEGKTTKLNVVFNPTNTTDDKTVVWSSSDTKVATVDANGVVKAVKAGNVKITAKVGDKTAEYALKVTAKANGTNNKNEKPADGGAVKTGDSNHISGFVVAMLLSIAAIVGVVIFKKRTHR